jgi:hypothetical protein
MGVDPYQNAKQKLKIDDRKKRTESGWAQPSDITKIYRLCIRVGTQLAKLGIEALLGSILDL